MARDKDLDEMQDPSSWDFERAERRPGVQSPRAVVSVAFARDDFERIARAAEELGKRTSEFIREAALERALQHRRLARLSSFSGSLGSTIFSDKHLSSTRVSASPTGLLVQEQAATTA